MYIPEYCEISSPRLTPRTAASRHGARTRGQLPGRGCCIIITTLPGPGMQSNTRSIHASIRAVRAVYLLKSSFHLQESQEHQPQV